MIEWVKLVTEWIGEAEMRLFYLKVMIVMSAIFTMVIAWILGTHINKLTERIEKLENPNADVDLPPNRQSESKKDAPGG
jgi:uncharacterized protein involved in cysteine biosynthesis